MNKSALVLSDTEHEFEQCHKALGQRWQLTTALGSNEALSKLDKETFSMLLVSSTVKSSDRASFEKEARRAMPSTPLIQFERQSKSEEFTFRSPQDNWQLQPNGNESEPIADQLARALLKQRFANDPGLKRLVPQIKTLPSWRAVYHKVVKEINSPDGSLATVAELVEDDPILTARILKTANSAAFGFRRRIADPQQAVMLLGGERLKSILIFTVVLSVTEYNQCHGFNPEKFWGQSVRSAELARKIMKSTTRDQTLIDAAFTAGLVHDIGSLLMAVNIPDEYGEILAEIDGDETLLQREEYRSLKTSHTELGTHILESWDLPYPILEAVLWHHDDERVPADGGTPLSAVFAADAILREQRQNPENLTSFKTQGYRRSIEIFGQETVESWLPSQNEKE
ncbi:HDOD domain-containing protein [Verrucomicrobia bacterium]|jgi:HD-like signal output (HDOD) protein|nr:HDOD domain-containing protein [Verrucomicrobiota bacterium]MDA7510677.1 HDOD domain-containing protein [Verrucomicrobiota bacterium]MDA7667449.1 HDOD domain-containing protein [bacterium]MDB4798536.1 HDOD domain-containing protein [Verrucomicrobiota bacterium]